MWTLIGGKEKGFITAKEFYEAYAKYMPSGMDRDMALEVFCSEIDSDKDGKIMYKDFYDTMLF
jgi:Ca2+-binding EF-hand superfamily protein